ncbi:thioredoxin family protein [Pontibacillus salicampi]|uniref:Thioredoxin family protein n=1 Tax=Pontibacillus salicampi TaxID=1449801 RepID=A0ABV6LN71_9BACI
MQEMEDNPLQILDEQSSTYTMTFIYSPFCGTCHVARRMLDTLEAAKQHTLFNELNASYHPAFMGDFQIESVPCLLITKGTELQEKVYAFQSVPYLLEIVSRYKY